MRTHRWSYGPCLSCSQLFFFVVQSAAPLRPWFGCILNFRKKKSSRVKRLLNKWTNKLDLFEATDVRSYSIRTRRIFLSALSPSSCLLFTYFLFQYDLYRFNTEAKKRNINKKTAAKVGAGPVMISDNLALPLRPSSGGHRHGCTAVGDGNTSPTTKLYEFYHLLPTVRIFSPCLMHGRI